VLAYHTYAQLHELHYAVQHSSYTELEKLQQQLIISPANIFATTVASSVVCYKPAICYISSESHGGVYHCSINYHGCLWWSDPDNPVAYPTTPDISLPPFPMNDDILTVGNLWEEVQWMMTDDSAGDGRAMELP
jgi:hypothetical protein